MNIVAFVISIIALAISVFSIGISLGIYMRTVNIDLLRREAERIKAEEKPRRETEIQSLDHERERGKRHDA